MTSNPKKQRRFGFGPARVALLLILPATGLIVLAGARERAEERSEPSPSAKDGMKGPPAASARLPSLAEILAHPDRIPTHNHPLVGRPAPKFSLEDTNDELWNLQRLQAGGPLVLIFYHGYLCQNCVRQLFEINRDLTIFNELNARVAAISSDPSARTRQRFEQYGRFGFPVLSDPENEVRQAYRVLRQTDGGKHASYLRHGTFIIDRHGKVQWANVGDAPFRRNSALLYQLAKIEGAVPR